MVNGSRESSLAITHSCLEISESTIVAAELADEFLSYVSIWHFSSLHWCCRYFGGSAVFLWKVRFLWMNVAEKICATKELLLYVSNGIRQRLAKVEFYKLTLESRESRVDIFKNWHKEFSLSHVIVSMQENSAATFSVIFKERCKFAFYNLEKFNFPHLRK